MCNNYFLISSIVLYWFIKSVQVNVVQLIGVLIKNMLQKLDKLTKRKFETKLVESLLRVTVTGRQIYFPFCGKIQDLHPNPKAQITLQAEEKS